MMKYMLRDFLTKLINTQKLYESLPILFNIFIRNILKDDLSKLQNCSTNSTPSARFHPLAIEQIDKVHVRQFSYNIINYSKNISKFVNFI